MRILKGIKILFLLLPLLSWGQNPMFKTSGNQTELTNNTFFAFENAEALPDSTILTGKFAFLPLKNRYPNFGFNTNDVWFRLIISPTVNTEKLFLHLNNPNLDRVDVFRKVAGENWENIAEIGDLRPLSNKKFNNRNPVIPLQTSLKTNDTIYLKINNGGEQFHFVPSLVTDSFFKTTDSKINLILGVYIGIMTFIFLFNLFAFFSLNERTALWYALYVFTLGFLQISLNGIGTQFIWSSDYLANHANPFFASTGVLFLLYFVMDYLKTKKYAPKLHRIFQFTHVFILICVVASVIPYGPLYRFSILGINGITLVLNVLIIPTAFYCRKKGLQEAGLFILAFSLLIISVFGFILKNFGLLPSLFITDFGMLIGSAVESILLSVGIVIRFKKARELALNNLKEINRITRDANEKLEEKVALRTQEVEAQKAELEFKNTEIVSSIAYAKRIQEAILPTENFRKDLLPNSELWYAPKDIVAGDFYWMNEIYFQEKRWVFFAVADCTGHGVPGAMMSVLCVNALELSLKSSNEPNPSKMLEFAAHFLSENFKTDQLEINDGMDISLACLCVETNELIWAGANNPLWILRNSELITVAPTKRPVGKTSANTNFENHTIEVQKRDKIILFTDGYADQFGGPKNKKLKLKALKELLEESAEKSISLQMNLLKTTFETWKGTEEQVDDVCILLLEI